jgi:hypothetical protein
VSAAATIATFAKGTMITVSTAGIIYGYFKIFWDEEWDWSGGALLKDFLSTLFFIVMMSIWPFAPRRYKKNWGPVGFFFGLAVVIGIMGLITAFTMGWMELPSAESLQNALMPQIPAY